VVLVFGGCADGCGSLALVAKVLAPGEFFEFFWTGLGRRFVTWSAPTPWWLSFHGQFGFRRMTGRMCPKNALIVSSRSGLIMRLLRNAQQNTPVKLSRIIPASRAVIH